MDICFYFHWVKYVGMVLLDCWVAIYLTLYEVDKQVCKVDVPFRVIISYLKDCTI